LTRADVEVLIRQAAAPKEVVKPSEQRKTFPWSEVPVPEGSNPDTMELCILPSLPPRLVYTFVRFIDIEPHRYIVDAHTGEILSAYFMGVVDRFRRHPKNADTGKPVRDTNSIPGPMHPTPIPVYKVPGSERVLPDTQVVPDSIGPGSRQSTLKHHHHKSPLPSDCLIGFHLLIQMQPPIFAVIYSFSFRRLTRMGMVIMVNRRRCGMSTPMMILPL